MYRAIIIIHIIYKNKRLSSQNTVKMRTSKEFINGNFFLSIHYHYYCTECLDLIENEQEGDHQKFTAWQFLFKQFNSLYYTYETMPSSSCKINVEWVIW